MADSIDQTLRLREQLLPKPNSSANQIDSDAAD